MTTENLTSEINPKVDKRTAILEAAQELFTSQGYEVTTIAQVAKKAGVAVGTVYLYFKNKVELLDGVRASFEAQFVIYMAQPELSAIPIQARIRPLIERCFSIGREQCDLVQLMGLQPQAIGTMGTNSTGGMIQQGIKLFAEQGIAEGVYRNIDPAVMAVISYGMVSHALEQCFQVENGQNQQLYVNTLVDALERWTLTDESYRKLHPPADNS